MDTELGRPIADILAEGPVLSVEFFPAKTEEGARQILRTANRIREIQPDFVSITYGAGGGTRQRTIEYGELLREIFGFEVMPHLTCVGHSRDELRAILERFHRAGFRNIMTLRGDPPKGDTEFKPHPDGFQYASELVAFIRENYPDFCLGVAGYPEKHPEAGSFEVDLKNLKHKVDQGGAFVTTQLFFNNEDFFRFRDNCVAAGIDKPIIPGVMIAASHAQVTKFCGFCGSRVPEELDTELAAASDDEAASAEVGIHWAHQQIKQLLEAGAPGVHLYILNKSQAPVQLFERLKKDGFFPGRK